MQIAAGINQQGRRKMLSVEIANSENATTWSNLFGRLRKRGLSGVFIGSRSPWEASAVSWNQNVEPVLEG